MSPVQPGGSRKKTPRPEEWSQGQKRGGGHTIGSKRRQSNENNALQIISLIPAIEASIDGPFTNPLLFDGKKMTSPIPAHCAAWPQPSVSAHELKIVGTGKFAKLASSA